MADARYRDRYVQLLVEDRDPSNNHMNIVESLLRPDQMKVYLGAFFENIEEVRYPSVEPQQDGKQDGGGT
jgi:hypothetical protein